MTSTITQILDRLDAVLQANAPVGTQVFRERTDAQSRQETPCINALVRDDVSTPFSAEMDRHEISVELRINVRADTPTPLAELVHQAVHLSIVRDPTLNALCLGVRQLGGSYEREEADLSSLIKAVRYRFIYLAPFDTI